MPITRICQSCGKSYSTAPSQKLKYCSTKCFYEELKGSERAERVITQCLCCGKEIHVTKYQHETGKGRFCSLKCRSQINNTSGVVELICPQCNKPFQVKPGRINAGRKFCSEQCVAESHKKRTTKKCKYCGKEFSDKDSNMIDRIYCSRACKGKDNVIHGIGNCAHCGNEFEKLTAKSKFCSKSCNLEYMGRSSIEIAMAAELDRRGIRYKSQYRIGNFWTDFAIPERKLVVECDGDYWHNLPGQQEKDAKRNTKLKERGWQVLRFWEHQINTDVASCVDHIVSALSP